MASYYDEVEVRSSSCKMNKSKLITKQIEDMDFDEENLVFHSPCPCGDRFEISLVHSNFVLCWLDVTNCDNEQVQLQGGEDIARCPSCSLIIRVIYDPVCIAFCDQRAELTFVEDDFMEDDRQTGNEIKGQPVEVAA